MNCNLKNFCIPFVLLFLLSSLAYGQLKYEGKVDQWVGKESQIVQVDMISREVIDLGSISADGDFEIILVEDFLKVNSKMTNEKQKAMDKGWKMKEKTVQSTYACGEDISYSNPEIVIGGPSPLMMVANVQEKERFGILQAASDEAVVKWYATFGESKAAEGYFLQWVYAEGDAQAEGSCEIKNCVDGACDESFIKKDIFDIELKKGWNIVKYEIDEVYEDVNGKVHPMQITQSTIAKLPKKVKWVFIPE